MHGEEHKEGLEGRQTPNGGAAAPAKMYLQEFLAI